MSEPCPAVPDLFRDSSAGHVSRCPRCQGARRLALDRTLRGSACVAIEPLLAARILDQLDAAQERELAAHLETCGACLSLAVDLDELPPDEVASTDLPELRVVEPDNYARGPEIGRGGMGRVMRARDRRLGRSVAIKELLDESLRERFEVEARLTARLQHPAIVNVLEAGRWPSGASFYAMKHVAGQPLDRLIARAPSLAGRLALLPNLIAVAEAVAYAHSVRVIHRDLKPANILVGPFGETVLIDWGLAKDLARGPADPAAPYRDAGAAQTAGGAGTPSYMAPEQAVAHIPDERVDVYALGATLYHLLAGVPPYAPAGSALAVLERLVAGPPRPIAELAPEAPRALVAIVAKAMAREPDARYPTAAQLADELRRFQGGQLVAAHSYTLGEHVARLVRRHRGVVALATASLVALAALGGVSVSKIETARQRAEAQLAELLVERGRQELAQAAPTRAFLRFAEAMEHGLDTPALRALLARASRSVDALVEVHPFPLTLAAARISPDGTRLAVATYDGTVRLLALPQATLVATLEGHTIPATILRFSPDGSRLLTSETCWVRPCDSSARVWEARTGELRAVLPHPAPIVDAEFEGGRVVVTRGKRGRLWWDLGSLLPRGYQDGDAIGPAVTNDWVAIDGTNATSAVVRGLPNRVRCNLAHGGTIARVGWSGDGRVAFTVGDSGGVRLWRTDGCQEIAMVDGIEGRPLDARLDETGEVLTVVGEGEMRAWRVRSRLALSVPNRAGVADVAMTPDGQVVTNDWSGAWTEWSATGPPRQREIDDSDGAKLERPPGALQAARGANGQVVRLGSDGRMSIWDRSQGRLLRQFQVEGVPSLAAGGLSLAPRGDLATTVVGLQAVAIWETANGRRRAMLIESSPIERVAWSPDGERLLTATADRVTTWDTHGQRLAQFAPGAGVVTVAAWSHDGTRLLVGGRDGSTRVCDASTGAELEVLGPSAASVEAVAFSSDDRLAVVAAGTRVRVWEIPIDRRPRAEVLAAADRVRRAGHQLLVDEPVPEAPPPGGTAAFERHLAGDLYDAARGYEEEFRRTGSARYLFYSGLLWERDLQYRSAAAAFSRYLAAARGAPDQAAVGVRIAALLRLAGPGTPD